MLKDTLERDMQGGTVERGPAGRQAGAQPVELSAAGGCGGRELLARTLLEQADQLAQACSVPC